MHTLAAQALLMAATGNTALFDVLSGGRSNSVTCQLDGAPQPGVFVHVDGALFEHVAVYSSGLSASGLLRWDKKALVLHVPEDGQKPFRVYRTVPRPKPCGTVEVVEEMDEYFSISIALSCAARLNNTE